MKTVDLTLQNESIGYSTEPAAYVEAKLAAAGRLLRTWKDRARTRRALAELSPQLLEDVGIGRDEARREAAKPFWRA